MTGFETRITTLEDGHRSIAEALQAIQGQLTTVQKETAVLVAHLSTNGGISVVVRERRVKFTGSMPIPWTLGLLGLGGVGGILAGFYKLLA